VKDRQEYLLEHFGGTKAFGDFCNSLRETTSNRYEVEDAINEMTTELLKDDLSKVRDIRAYAKGIFHRRLKELISKSPISDWGYERLPREKRKVELQSIDPQLTGVGYQYYQPKETKYIPESDIKHPLLRALIIYTSFGMNWEMSIEDEEKEEQREKAMWRMVRHEYRVSKNRVNKLPDKVKARMEKYLYGYSESEIAMQEGVKTRQAISYMLATTLRKWGWNNEKIKKLRIIWLISTLADIGEQMRDERRKCWERSVVKQDKLKAYHECLYQRITNGDIRTKLLYDMTMDDIVKLDDFLPRLISYKLDSF
jgi:hypothetical protein